MIDPEQDSPEKRQASPADLKRVSEKASEMIRLQTRIESGMELLADLKKQLIKIETESLPSLMTEVGMSSFTLAGGWKIVIKPIISASLPAEGTIEKEKDKEKAEEMRERFEKGIAYLEKEGAGAIIKQVIKADFGKDSKAKVTKALAALKKLGIDAEAHRAVHPMTLTSWVKERLEAGSPVDYDLLGVYTGEKAEIQTSKAKKPKASF